MFVCCECCVLSGRGLCDKLITRPGESYRLCCVVVCDLENLKNEEAMTRVGSQRHRKKKIYDIFNCNWVVYTFTHKQYIEQHNSLIRKSADRAPSLRGIHWHLAYNWGKGTEKPQSG